MGTTLLDERRIRKSELNARYRRRWNLALDPGCIKSTLGLGVRRSSTPAMIENERWICLLAYNLNQ